MTALPESLRRGSPGRPVLLTILLEKIGSGLWLTSAAIYLTQILGLSVRTAGMELGLAGLAGLAGSPIAGTVAERIPVPRLCSFLYLVRAVATCLLLLCTSVWTLPVALCGWTMSDRGTAALQRLLVADAAGVDRSRFQAMARVVTNIGLGLGALGAAGVLVADGAVAFRVMITVQGAMYLCAALGVLRVPAPRRERAPQAMRGAPQAMRGARHAMRGARHAARHRATFPRDGVNPVNPMNPWRDRGYLLFTLLELPLFLDNSLMGVGLPLWIVHLGLPHLLVSVAFVLNTASVIAFQLRMSALARTPRRTAAAIPVAGVAFLTGCCCAALAVFVNKELADVLLILAAAAVTAAEMIHTVTSWELAIALAPTIDRPRYIGVYGLAQAGERAGGPLLMTSLVLVSTASWPVLGAGLLALSVVQRRIVRSRYSDLEAAHPVVQTSVGSPV